MSPTKIDVELFMWAYGLGQNHPNDFFKEAIVFKNNQDIKIGPSISTKKAKEENKLRKEKEKNKNNN